MQRSRYQQSSRVIAESPFLIPLVNTGKTSAEGVLVTVAVVTANLNAYINAVLNMLQRFNVC